MHRNELVDSPIWFAALAAACEPSLGSGQWRMLGPVAIYRNEGQAESRIPISACGVQPGEGVAVTWPANDSGYVVRPLGSLREKEGRR